MDILSASSVGCKRCPLACSRKSIVDGAGHTSARLMVVGEQPGPEEDRASSPFVGAGGRLTRSALENIAQRIGVDASRIFYTYAVRCKPNTGEHPTAAELEQCASWLMEELDTVQPKCILALGSIAQAQVMEVLDPDQWPLMKKAFAPYYIVKNRSKLGNWMVQLEIALRRAFDLPALSTFSGAEADSWTFGDPDLDAPYIGADTEFDTLLDDTFDAERVGWSLSDGERSIFRTDEPIPLPHVYLHAAKADILKLGINPDDLAAWDDTLLMAYCLRKWEQPGMLGLKTLGPKLTGLTWKTDLKDMLKVYIPSGSIFKSGPRKGQEKPGKWRPAMFSEAIATRWDDASEYAATDAVVTSRLARELERMMDADPWARDYYESMEKPLLPVLLAMEQAGVRIDVDAMRAAEVDIKARRAETEENLRAVFGADVNMASSQQIGPLLLERGVVDGKRTDTGGIGTGKANVLAAFGVEKPEQIPTDTEEGRIARDYLEWKQMGKLQSTYVDAFLGRPAEGKRKAVLSRLDVQSRVHGRYNQATSVNRLSSSDPNLQNIPSRTDIGMAIRAAFVPAPGNVFVGGDFSQLQPRIWAEYTHDPVFLRAYQDNPKGDIYQPVADEMVAYGVTRQIAKPIVLGAMYGGGDETLGHAAGVPIEKMSAFLRELHERMPSIHEWPQLISQLLSSQGYVESMMGWRMYFPDYAGMVNRWSSAALREAANAPIISSEAGLVKAFMVEVYHTLKREFPLWRLVLQVHDELWAEGPVDQADEVKAIFPEIAARVARRWITAVPIRFDPKTVTNWKEGK